MKFIYVYLLKHIIAQLKNILIMDECVDDKKSILILIRNKFDDKAEENKKSEMISKIVFYYIIFV
jgi:hypothetical protein